MCAIMYRGSLIVAKTVCKNKKRKWGIFDIVNTIFLGLLSIIMLYPFYNVFITSFAKFEDIIAKPVYLLPVSFQLDGYKMVFSESSFYNGFGVTVIVTVVGTAICMVVSLLSGYALSKKSLPGRNIILAMILFTMFFNGGLIPFYLVVSGIGLVNSIWSMILPAAISTWYMIIMKNYFNTIPASLEESARLDGANDLQILAKIILPVSKPIIATFSLFYAVERWNEWWNALLFISDESKRPLQIVLRQILINVIVSDKMRVQLERSQTRVFEESVQMAAIVITLVPIICLYPFLQKYFVKGIMVGSIKE